MPRRLHSSDITCPVNSDAWSDISRLWNPEHREKLVVKDTRRSVCGMVIGDICLGKACEVILDDQNVLHDRLLCHTHHYLHGDVADMNQI